MGNSTGSMFYMFVVIIAVYIVGMCIYLWFQKFKQWINKRNDLKFQERRDHHD